MSEPDPRVVRTRQRVRAAALDLLAERGYPGLSIEGVAERSGVAKSTIYRHWPGLAELLLDAFAAVNADPPPVARTGSLRTDLHAHLTELARAVTGSHWGTLMASLVDAAERDDRFAALIRDFVEHRRRRLGELLHDARDRGELPAGCDPDLLAGVIGGHLFYRRLIGRQPIDDRLVDDLTAIVERLAAR